MENLKIVAIFNDAVTETAILDIESKHKDLVHDFSNEEEFKAARKVRAEMNKLLGKVDRVGIDAANDIAEKRSALKDKIEQAYSGTVGPFLIENQKRIDEAKRIKKEKELREQEQQEKLNMMKGASARAIHLNLDEIENILQDVMNVDISSFDESLKKEAELAKEISISQIGDAFKFATEKEEMRKAKELQEAAMADKEDELERMRKEIAKLKGEDIEAQESTETISDALAKWRDSVNIVDCEFYSLIDTVERFVSLDITEK